jgi:tetratricopeptide (TPR) repeat protein
MTKGAGLIGKEQPFLKPALCGSLLVALGILTWRQAGLYADVDTLWRATIDRNPDSFMAQNNLANDLMAQGQVEEAIAHYRRALEIRPAGAAVDYNLGIALASRGQVEEAILHFRRALELRPDGAAIAYKLANALLSKGQLDESIVYYRRALEIEPEGAAIACSLGNALNEKGQVDEAIACFSRALAISPGLARAHSGLGTALARKGRLAEAIAEYGTALAAQPADVSTLANLAWVLATCPDPALRDGPRAVDLAERAARLSNVRSLEVLKVLSAAYAEAGRFPEAAATDQQALELASRVAGPASVDEIRAEIRLYEAHSPFRDPSLTQTNAPSHPR